MKVANIVQDDDKLRAACLTCGSHLAATGKRYRCRCGLSGDLPQAVWTAKGTRVSVSVPISASRHVITGWVASWLEVPQKEVSFWVTYE